MNCVANLEKGKHAIKTQKVKKTRASAKTPVAKTKAENRKLPPDPDRLFERGAARAKKVIALYEKLNPGLEDEHLVSNIVRDLICLSARNLELGNVDEGCVFAMETYLEFAAKNICEAGWYGDMEAAREAAEKMMYPDLEWCGKAPCRRVLEYAADVKAAVGIRLPE